MSRVLVGPVVVAVLALLVRVGLQLLPDPMSFGRYDDGVHFAAALGLVHGRLPYRDVLFLQPPGVVLVLVPFALLAGVVGDGAGFAIARGAFASIGVLNAVLVVLVARRAGAVAAWTGGIVYALASTAVYVEQSTLMEVPGTTCVLLGLLLVGEGRGRPRAAAVLAGVAAGAAVVLKIWYLVPLLVLLVAARRRAPAVLVGATGAVLVGYLPFLVAAPAAMWREVVLAQLGRPRTGGTGPDVRLATILGLDPGPVPLANDLGTAVLLALVVVLAVLALRSTGGPAAVGLLVGCTIVLLAAPSYFPHYAVLDAAPLALVGGIGSGRAVELLGGRRAAVPVVAAVAAIAVASQLPTDLERRTHRHLPVEAIATALHGIEGCVVADDPTVLILADRLSPDLDRECDVRVDPSGYGYLPTGTRTPQNRRRDPRFQRSIVAYLRSADGYVLARGAMLGLTPATAARLRADRTVVDQGGVIVRQPR